MKEYMQQKQQDPEYDMDEAKHNKEGKQERGKDSKYHTDEAK